MKALLDTSVVLATGLGPLEGELAISAATLSELQVGVLVATDPAVRAARLRRLSALQSRFDALPVDGAVAASSGRLPAAVVAAGRKPRARTMDLLIAATATSDRRSRQAHQTETVGGGTHIEHVGSRVALHLGPADDLADIDVGDLVLVAGDPVAEW